MDALDGKPHLLVVITNMGSYLPKGMHGHADMDGWPDQIVPIFLKKLHP
jgi:hypothetical protein